LGGEDSQGMDGVLLKPSAYRVWRRRPGSVGKLPSSWFWRRLQGINCRYSSRRIKSAQYV